MKARDCSQLQIHRCSMLKDGDKLSKYWQSLLCKHFWQPARFNMRKQWILNRLKNVQSRRVSFQIKHAEGRKWLVPDLSGQLVEVTRQYFLRTVAFKWDTVYCVLLKNYYLSRNSYIYNKFAGRSSRCVHLRRVICMHIKSYLRKYSCSKKSKDRVRQVYDYSLLRRVFRSFKAKYPFLAASFSSFMIIFHAVSSVIAVDNTCLSIMPDVSLLNQAYQKCDLSNTLDRDSSTIDNNPRIHPQLSTSQGSIHGCLQPNDLVAYSPAQDNDNLSPTYSENMNFLIRNEQKINTLNPGVKEATNVILHLDIQNDPVINLNAKDNDCHRQEVSASVVKKGVIDIPSYNHNIVPFHYNTYNRGLKFDPAGVRHTLLPVCRCKRKCFTKFSEQRTSEICESFSQLKDSAEENKWIMRHVEKSDEKQCSRHKKKKTRNYLLTDWRGRHVNVCSEYFQRVLSFAKGSLQEPLIDNSDLRCVAGQLHDNVLITGHQRDPQPTIKFPGNSGGDFNHDEFCNVVQNLVGSARNMNISGPYNKGHNLDTSQYIHIDNSSNISCQRDAANNKSHHSHTSQYVHIYNSRNRSCQKDAAKNSIKKLINNDCFSRKTFKKHITKGSITKHKDTYQCGITSRNKRVAKDCIIKHMNIDACKDRQQHIVKANTRVDVCIRSKKDVQQDGNGNSGMDQSVHSTGCKARGQGKNNISTGVCAIGSKRRSDRNNRSKNTRVLSNDGSKNVGPGKSAGNDNVYIDADKDCDCCNRDLSKDSSGRVIAGCRKRGQAKCINKDRTVKNTKMCCVSTRSQDIDVNVDGSKNRGRRTDTKKDRTVICSSENKNKMKNSSSADINIDGCRSRGRRKDTRKDRTASSESISSSDNKSELKDNLTPDINIGGCRSRGQMKDPRKDRIVDDESISSSGKKREMKDSLIPDINIAGTRNRGCGANKDKERSNVREYLEQHDRQLGRAATRSRDRTVKKLHQGFLSCYASSRISYEEFRRICDQVHNAGLASMGSVSEDKVGSNVPGMLGSALESRSFTRRMRSSSLVGGERHEFEMPEGRKRSTRLMRMQSTMVEEDDLLQGGKVDSDAFILECAQGLHADQQPGLGCSEGRLTLHSKPRVAAKQRLDKSEKLMASQFVTGCQQSENSHSGKQEMNVQSSQLNQPTLRSGQLARNKDGSCAGKKYNTSRHTRKKKIKKETKESISIQLTNDNRGHIKSFTNSKKLCKLSTLKKKDKHPMLPPCNCSRRRCIESIPEDRRREIHDQFWNMSSYKDRKRWLVKYVEKRERKNKVLSLFPQRKNEHKRYFLPDYKNNVVEVCRLFFIHTLGFKWDSVVDAVVRTKISSCVAVGHTSHQLKKLPRQLPDYVVESVTEYLISVRNSCDVTNEACVKKLFDDEEAADWNTETVCNVDQANELPRLKVKDLFKRWKVKYKSLKFNLGYHSFRRIFQNVIDPMLVSQEKVTKDNRNTHATDVYSIACADVDYTPSSETPNTYTNITKYQQATTAGFSDKQSGLLKPLTNLKVLSCTESINDSELTISTKNESENLKVDSKSICQGSECIDLINCSGLQENLHEDENCILDVGSGFFKRADDCKNTSRYPYTSETKYKKRRSMSMRNDRSNYPVLPPCKCRKRKCAEKFTEPQRQQINTMFWDLDSYNDRKQWILEHIKRADIKRRIVSSEGTPRKLESRWYHLPDADGNKVDVCKGFFLRTLGYRWDSVIDTIGKTTPKGVKWAAPDRRGRKPPPHKISDEAVASMALYIQNVCNTYQPVCHKRSRDDIKECKTSTGGQIPLGLTMKQLFVDYKSKHPNHKFGYESFRKIFRRVHGDFVASLPPDVESSEKPDIVNSKINASDDKDYLVVDTCLVEKGSLVSKDCSVEKDYSVDEDCLVGTDYPVDRNCSIDKDYSVGKDYSLEKDYLVVKNCLFEKDNPVGKDFSIEKDYVIGKVYSVRTDYPESRDCSAEQDYLVDKDYSEATDEGCSGSFRPEDSHFAPVAVSYPESNLATHPHSAPTPPPPPHPVPDNHHQPLQQHQVGSLALDNRSCLYQSHHHAPNPQHHLPVMQIPDRIEPLAPDRYSSVDNDPLMMYNHNLYCPPIGVPGHFTHVSDHLGHMSGVNPQTNLDVATCGVQSQFPAYFVPNPEPLHHQVYQVTSQYQSILHQLAESSRFFSYGYPPAENPFHETSDKHNLFRKQEFCRNNMNCCNIPKISYNHVSEPASVQAQYHPQNHLVYTNAQPESTTILSTYSEENDNSFAQDHQQIPNATFNQDSVITGFSNGFPSRMDSKESASKVKIPTKKRKSEKQKVKKEMKMKSKSLRNYGGHYPMLGPCNCKKKKCTEKFCEEARQKLHDMFWDLKDYNERKQWMLQHIKREDCKRRRIDQFESFRKLESRWYFFPDESGQQHEVCKDFFLRTLGYKWDSVIDTIRRTTPKGETTTRPDQRGRKAPAHKLCNAVLRSVVQYIKSMQQVSQPLDDHVESVEDSNCEQGHQHPIDTNIGQIAVPYGLTMKDLYDDYKVKHAAHKIGYESFRRIFRDVSKSEKIIFDDKTDEDEFLGPKDQDLVDF